MLLVRAQASCSKGYSKRSCKSIYGLFLHILDFCYSLTITWETPLFALIARQEKCNCIREQSFLRSFSAWRIIFMAFSIETFAKSEKLPTYKKNIAFCDIGEYISQCFEPLRQTGMKISFNMVHNKYSTRSETRLILSQLGVTEASNCGA